MRTHQQGKPPGILRQKRSSKDRMPQANPLMVLDVKAVAPPEEPEEGETKCVGSDLYEFVDRGWVMVEENSPQCVVAPPAKVSPWPLLIGVAGVAVLVLIKRGT